MSGQRWEYASVVYTYAARKISPDDSEFQRLSPEAQREYTEKGLTFHWWFEQKIYIWLPHASDADVRVAWESGDEKRRVAVLDILNELGADGWENMSNTVRGSAMGKSYGWTTASYPVEERHLLKRPVS